MNISEAICRIPFLLGDLIDWPTNVYPDRIALQSPEGALSYAQLDRRIAAAAYEYRRLGASRFVRWGLALKNSPEFFIHFFALARSGCVVAPLNPCLPPERLREIIESDSLSGLTIPAETNGLSSLIRSLPGFRTHSVSNASALSPPLESVSTARLIDVDPALILRSSGSKGEPRGVVVQHHALLANLCANIRALGYRDDDKTLVVLPLQHSYGLVHQALCHLALGATVVLPPVPLVAPFFVNGLSRYGITTLSTAPPVLRILLDGLRRVGSLLPELRLITVGTARADIEIIREVQRLLPQARIAITYGLTESGPRVSTQFLDAEGFDPACVGVPLPNVEVSLDRASDENSAEVVVRGRSLMRNYACESREEGGDCSLHTGDIGELHDGKLYLLRRRGRSINRGGVVVAPENIEKVLQLHPSVQSARVYAERDSFWGEVPVASVTLRRTSIPTPESELLQFCAARLPTSERPIRISVNPTAELLKISKDAQMSALFE
jgi:acyl-CoA synthetase (AMP-forming)/AMP-acid ligase II